VGASHRIGTTRLLALPPCNRASRLRNMTPETLPDLLRSGRVTYCYKLVRVTQPTFSSHP